MSALDDVELRRRLNVVWLNEPPCRYVPKAFTRNGGGWGVFDRKTGKFLKNSKVKKLTFENVCEKLVN